VRADGRSPIVVETLAIASVVLGVAAFLVVPTPLVEKLRVAMTGVSAQRPDHTLALGGVMLPLEARMMGIFLGFGLSTTLLWLLGRGRWSGFPPATVGAVLLLALGAMVADGLNAFLFDGRLPALYAPSNDLRLATGLLAGLALAGFVLPVVQGAVWRDPLDAPIIASVGEALFLAAPLAVTYVVARSGAAAALLPLAVLGPLGVLGSFALVSAYVLVLALPRLKAEVARDLVVPAVLGLWLAVVELLLLAVLRWGMAALGVRWVV